jgi:hypothetical protein
MYHQICQAGAQNVFPSQDACSDEQVMVLYGDLQAEYVNALDWPVAAWRGHIGRDAPERAVPDLL